MIILVIALLFGLIGGFMANAKGKNVFLWFALCALFPLIGILILLFSKDDSAPTPAPVYVPAQQPGALPAPPYDVARWNALVEYDPELKEAAARLAVYGQAYVDKLATDFLTLNDRSYLPTIVAKTQKLAKAELARGQNAPDYDVSSWSYYADYDPDVQAAIQRLKVYGPGYVDMLARAFLAAKKDKSQLGSVVEEIERVATIA